MRQISLLSVAAFFLFYGSSLCRDYRGITPLDVSSLLGPGVGFVDLGRHQDDSISDDEDVPYCRHVCTSDTCGGPQCLSELQPGKRTFFDFEDYDEPLTNLSEPITLPWGFEEAPRLQARRFGFTPENLPTVQALTNYVFNQVENPDKPADYKGFPVQPFYFDGPADDRPVARQQEFGSQVFQWGTDWLVGCTMVVLVSKRAVWMAHYFEGYSNGDGDTNKRANYDPLPGTVQFGGRGSVDFEFFEERVLNQILNIPVDQSPPPIPMVFHYNNGEGRTVSKKSPYIRLTDAMPHEPINFDLFNAPDDDTQLYYFTPMDDFPGSATEGEALYGQRFAEVTAVIKGELPNLQVVAQRLYAKDQAIPEENNLDALGCVLFQYDPNGYGPRQPGWRLFMEEYFAGGKVPRTW